MYIGYTCESGIAVVHSRSDMGRDNLGSKTIKQKLTYRRNFPDCKKHGTAQDIGVLFNRQCLIKVYSTVLNKVLKGNAISTNICRLAADQTDDEPSSMILIFSLPFLRLASVCYFASMTECHLCRFECWTVQNPPLCGALSDS